MHILAYYFMTIEIHFPRGTFYCLDVALLKLWRLNGVLNYVLFKQHFVMLKNLISQGHSKEMVLLAPKRRR